VNTLRAWFRAWVIDDGPADPSPLDLANGVGLTRGTRAWLADQYPAGTVERVEATVRAANEARRA
jgi:hypothetical protein